MTSSDTSNSGLIHVISVDTTGQNLLKCIRPDNVHCIIPKPEAKIKGLGIPALHEYAVQFLFYSEIIVSFNKYTLNFTEFFLNFNPFYRFFSEF